MLLSVVIVSYNSKHVLEKCLDLLKRSLAENFVSGKAEIIVVDNHSEAIEQTWLKKISGIKAVFLPENVGFARANNVALKLAKGQYVLFLNSDLYLNGKIDFQELINFLGADEKKAGLTVKVLLPNGQIDPASHRGFPNLTNSLAYFSGLEKLTAKVKYLNQIFGGYHLTSKDLETLHEIDSPTAAFWLVKKSALDQVNGFDPDYFFYGEDLDLSYRLKKLGYSLWYYPAYQVLHLKYQSSKKSQSAKTKAMTRTYFYQTMALFMDKHYREKYPKPLLNFAKLGIKLLSSIRP